MWPDILRPILHRPIDPFFEICVWFSLRRDGQITDTAIECCLTTPGSSETTGSIREKVTPCGRQGKLKIEKAFNADLLNLLRSVDYTTITVVIDKYEHLQRYEVWHYDPYHYCQEVLLERYVLWLEERDSSGDVMAESRGGREDRRLKESFSRIWNEGTRYVPATQFASRLTSKQLKVKTKANNIAGLQLADLLAHPSFKYVLSRHQRIAQPQTFGAKIARILVESKYLRSPSGKLDGWGCKWLP